jgi:putative transposase
MKKKFTEEQIIKILNRNRNGESPKTLGREFGVSEVTIYSWKKKFANMTVNEAKRLRELEHENMQLKKLVANQALDIVMLKDVNSKKW